MARIVLSLSETLLFIASLYGWGSLVNRRLCGSRQAGWAFLSSLGFAVLIAVGGLLNALCIAKPPVLIALFLAGLGMAVFFIFRSFQGLREVRSAARPLTAKPCQCSAGDLAHLLLLLSVFLFSAMVLMPTRTFNFHDDFHVYLMWPVRMLQTGSLAGNPFDHIGVSSLGGQSFMQGMFLAFGKLADVNAMDAILCLLLLLGLFKELGEEIGASPVFAIAAGLLAVFINPHYVNISSLYSGSLMLLGLTHATVFLARSSGSSSSAPGLMRAVLPCALFYAALLTLKTTYVFVALSFWGVSLLGSLLLIKERRQMLLSHLSCAGITTLLLLPWISLYFDRYLRKIHDLLNEIGYAQDTSFSPEETGDVLTTLLSSEGLFYGNTYRDYLGLVAILLFASLSTAWLAWRNKDRREASLSAPFLALFLSTVVSYGLQYNFGPARLVVRYSLPLLIGAAPAAILIAGQLWEQAKHHLQAESAQKKVALGLCAVLLVSHLALLMAFRETFIERIQRAYDQRTLLSFPLAEDAIYQEYNDYVLNGQGAKQMSRIQETVPVGETIFAWASMPLLLDFGRNPIYTINESSLAYNLLVMPLAGGAKALRDYFRQYGIRYIIWDYNGYGMKRPAEMGSMQNDLIENLKELIPMSEVLYHDGVMIVFDIGRDT